MKAIFKASPSPGALYGEVADLAPKEDELLIKVHRASICGSDLPIYQWNSWAPERIKVPMVFGHEFCGTVESWGSGVSGFAKGDFVSVESHIYCRRCLQCRQGQSHVCQSMKIIGLDGPGGFSERAAIPARCAWKHRGDKFKDLGSLMEPLGNAVYSALVEDVAGKTVLVLGCGPQGLFATAVAAASGAASVVAVESSSFRAGLARRMGAKEVAAPGDADLIGKLLKAGKCPGGFDAVLEMSGSPQAISLAFKAVRKGGRITAFGIPSKKVELDWANDLIFKGVRVYGIVGRRIFGTWEKMQELLDSGAIDIAPVVTHSYPMKDFADAFSAMVAPEKNCGKVLLIP
ncbi:MAG: alcohol dehydrogenase catalytic domain-containing protein [Elusimicrobia bacterium]|nr:alcohol dehydrogenase catalytic domain-containing protein [Elusimicrobiota bacterium]